MPDLEAVPPQHVVAAFDFDKTLSTRDNVVPFLRAVAGTGAVARALSGAGAGLLMGGRDARRRETIKAELVRRLLSGLDAAELDDIARRFADDVCSRHLRAEAVERAEWHREQGHRLVIVSASFGAYLRPVADRLHFDAVLATELHVADDGRLTGRLAGPNVRGDEKVRRLEQWLGREPVYLWAYGDGAGDRALWARADRAVRIGRRRRWRLRPEANTGGSRDTRR